MSSKKLFDDTTISSKKETEEKVKRTKTTYSKEFYDYAESIIKERNYINLYHNGSFPENLRENFVNELKEKFPEYKDVKWKNVWHRLYQRYILNKSGNVEFLKIEVATAPIVQQKEPKQDVVENVENSVENDEIEKPKVDRNRSTVKDGAKILYDILKERFEYAYKDGYNKITSNIPHDRLVLTEQELRDTLKLDGKYKPLTSLRGLANKIVASIRFNDDYSYFVYNFTQYTLDGVVHFRFDTKEKYGWNYKVSYKLAAKLFWLIPFFKKEMHCTIRCTQSELPNKIAEMIDNEIENTKLMFGIKPKKVGNPSIVLGEQFSNM